MQLNSIQSQFKSDKTDKLQQTGQSNDIIEGIIELIEFSNINTRESNIILSPNQQLIAIVFEQDVPDDDYRVYYFQVVIFQLVNQEHFKEKQNCPCKPQNISDVIYQGQQIKFDINMDQNIYKILGLQTLATVMKRDQKLKYYRLF